MSHEMTDVGVISIVTSSNAANTGPTLVSASASWLRYLRCSRSFHLLETSPVTTFAVPVMLMPRDAVISRESIMIETVLSDCRLRALRLRDDVATYTCPLSKRYQTATM